MRADQQQPQAPARPVTVRDAEALVGIEYRDGHMDCMHLAVLAQRVLFGRVVPWQHRTHPVRTAEQVAMVNAHMGQLARRLGPDEQPQSGDGVLWLRPDTGAGRGFHIGTLFLLGAERWVLHTSEALGESVLQRMSEANADGLTVEGIYRWLA